MLTITKDFSFDASHRLWNQNFDEDENLRIYGKCANFPSHGHTYKLSITIRGESDNTGMIMNFTDLKKIVNREIIEKFDHHSLNDFYEIPTCENMVVDIFKKLQPLLKGLKRVDLYEQIYPTNSYASYEDN